MCDIKKQLANVITKIRNSKNPISRLIVHLLSSKKAGNTNGNKKVRAKLTPPVIAPKAVAIFIFSAPESMSIRNGSKNKSIEKTLKAAKILNKKLERLAENDGKGCLKTVVMVRG